jgi:hypothetical protein
MVFVVEPGLVLSTERGLHWEVKETASRLLTRFGTMGTRTHGLDRDEQGGLP